MVSKSRVLLELFYLLLSFAATKGVIIVITEVSFAEDTMMGTPV